MFIKYIQIQQQFQKEKNNWRNWALNIAHEWFTEWQNKTIATIQADANHNAVLQAKIALENWKLQYEQTIRQDAIKKSQAVTLGKITEHIAPYMPTFNYNPKDARFIGSPIDLIIFNGLNNQQTETPIEIIFLEIKTGNSSLSKTEKRIRDAVQAGRIKWEEMHINTNHNSN